MSNIGVWELLLATAVLAFGGVHAVMRARHKERIGLTDVAVWFVAMFFGVGPWMSVLAGGFMPERDPKVVFLTYLGVLLFMAGLVIGGLSIGAFVSWRAKGEPGEDRRGLAPIMAQVGLVNAPFLLALYAAALVVKLYMGYKYRIFFSGDMEQTLMPIPYSVRTIAVFASLITDATFLWAVVMCCARGRYRHAAAVVLFIGLLLAFTVGRRWILSSMFLIGLCYYMYRGVSLRVIVVAVLLGATLMYVAMPFFWRLRYYRQNASDQSDAVASVVYAGIRAATDWDNPALREAYRQNLAARPMFIGFNVQIVDAQQTHPVMMGRVLWGCVLWTVPSVFYQGKMLMVGPEEDIEEFYGMPPYDASSNWPAYGQADYGLPGAFLYGVIFAGIVGFVEVFAVRIGWRAPILGILFASAMYGSVTAVEETAVYLICTLRDAIFLAVPFVIALPLVGRARVSEDALAYSADYPAGSEPAA